MNFFTKETDKWISFWIPLKRQENRRFLSWLRLNNKSQSNFKRHQNFCKLLVKCQTVRTSQSTEVIVVKILWLRPKQSTKSEQALFELSKMLRNEPNKYLLLNPVNNRITNQHLKDAIIDLKQVQQSLTNKIDPKHQKTIFNLPIATTPLTKTKDNPLRVQFRLLDKHSLEEILNARYLRLLHSIREKFTEILEPTFLPTTLYQHQI